MMICFSLFRKRRKISRPQIVQNEEIPGGENIKIYSYKELRNATGDFSPANKVGEGGFGSVYKGTLKDGQVVALKVLSSESRQGIREFLNELVVIADIVHENLVRLCGCCAEGNHRILVYDYIENNSLAQTLLGRDQSNIQFSWRARFKICIGIARGLKFLHEEVKPHIVHRDIKASNILLEKDLTPKISDFGLAKLLPDNMSHISTRVAGTIFGVLLLEIVSGTRNLNTRLPYEDQFLIERTWTLYERGELVKIVDTCLDDDFDIKEACRFVKIGLLCTQDNPRLRPSMSSVVKMLTCEGDINLEITRPGLISDFMDLKIRKATKADELKSSPLQTLPLLQANTRNATMSFTTHRK